MSCTMRIFFNSYNKVLLLIKGKEVIILEILSKSQITRN